MLFRLCHCLLADQACRNSERDFIACPLTLIAYTNMDSSEQQQRHAANLSVFQSLQSSLEEEASLREKIRDSVREFDSNVRSLTAQSVYQLHVVNSTY